jgi:hypothetical protein
VPFANPLANACDLPSSWIERAQDRGAALATSASRHLRQMTDRRRAPGEARGLL